MPPFDLSHLTIADLTGVVGQYAILLLLGQAFKQTFFPDDSRERDQRLPLLIWVAGLVVGAWAAALTGENAYFSVGRGFLLGIAATYTYPAVQAPVNLLFPVRVATAPAPPATPLDVPQLPAATTEPAP